MPIIKASAQFENSNIDQDSLFNYIKPDVRQLKFDKENNADGVWVLFLPAYKQDSFGNGAWFKKFTIRKGFGVDKVKKTYYVKDQDEDPALYFERAFKARYPEQAKMIKAGTAGNDTKFNIYPNYGHYVQRVAFNTGILNALREAKPIDKVVHVLDVPSYKGADQLTSWMSTIQPDGQPSPLISDHEAAVGVFVHKSSEMGAKGGWRLEPSMAHRYKVPDVYADSANLYNLDDIFIEVTAEEIISDLRSMYSAAVFDICMDGYSGFKTTEVFPNSPLPATAPVSTPAVTPLPPPPQPGITALPSPTVAPAVQVAPLPPPPTAPPVSSLQQSDTVVVGGKEINSADLRAYLEKKDKDKAAK